MDHVLVKDPSGSGKWLLILGCQWSERHELVDLERGISGPTFATCAYCEHQRGVDAEARDAELDWSAQIFPERLACGYPSP